MEYANMLSYDGFEIFIKERFRWEQFDMNEAKTMKYMIKAKVSITN